jgi:hypothetical protein
MKESEIEHDIMQYLAIRHIPAFQTHGLHHLPGGGVRIVRPHRKGMLDICCTLPQSGRTCLIEVKAEDGMVSEEQEAVMREWHAARALVFVARSVQDVADQIDAAQRADAIITLDGDVFIDSLKKAGKRSLSV